MIEVENLAKSFGSVVAVDGLSLAAQDGRITGLLGPNGAGKTTTLRTVYGLQKPDRGRVTIDGFDVASSTREAARRVGVFPDAIGLYDRLTTREHLQFFGRMHGLEGRALEDAIERCGSELQIGELMERRCKGFSHGQRMKVALARAIIHRPRNLILDEPTNGLDVMSIRMLRGLLAGFRREGRCILFSSHVMQEVSALCDDIYLMADGRAVAKGTPEELCRQAGEEHLEDAFVRLIGTEEGIAS